eukprot:15355947-Ditylum_brightwellii.AAC.1
MYPGVKTHPCPYFDVLSKIKQLQVDRISFLSIWEKAHQDNSTNMDKLSLPTKLNCDCNHKAAAFLATPSPTLIPEPSTLCYPEQVATLQTNGATATSNEMDLLWNQPLAMDIQHCI